VKKGHELLLGQEYGWLEVFDIGSATITHSWKIREDSCYIADILAIDKTHLLLAT
jgi:hypothetical protein